MFRDRQEQNLFFTSLYYQALRSAKRRYGGNENIIYSYQDAVHETIIYVNSSLQKRTFQSKLHLTCYFWLTLKGKAAGIYSRKRREVSLNSSMPDSECSLEDFIASRIVYPSLEDEEKKGEIEKALKVLSSEQRELITQVWIQGKLLTDIKGNQRYLQRLLDDAKLKLYRKLIGQKIGL
jgi:DNA-directed RNA polymerase specialized sigma24 family protein